MGKLEGTPLNSPGEDWSFLEGHFRRVPLKARKTGVIGATGSPILIKDFAPENEWIARQDWAKREGIRSFGGHPLICHGKILGVLALFSRQPLDEQEFIWLRSFADQAAVAITNARAFEAAKQVEAKIRQSERELRQVLDLSPQHLAEFGPHGSRLYSNQAALDYYGLTLEEWQSSDLERLLHPQDAERISIEAQSSFLSGSPYETEARLVRKDGKHRWFLFRLNPVRDEQ